jgi:phage tail-like protein
MARPDPLRNFRFRLEIDGIEQAAFSEVSIGALSNDPIEYREGDELTTARKLTSLTKYGNAVLKWGVTASMELSEWHQLVVAGATLLEEIRKTVTRAWPCKYDPTDLKGLGNEVAIDTLELCNEGIRRIQ